MLRWEKGRMIQHLGFFSHICTSQPRSSCICFPVTSATTVHLAARIWGSQSHDLHHWSLLFPSSQLCGLCVKGDSSKEGCGLGHEVDSTLESWIDSTPILARGHRILHPQIGQVTHCQLGKLCPSWGNSPGTRTTVTSSPAQESAWRRERQTEAGGAETKGWERKGGSVWERSSNFSSRIPEFWD